MEKQAWINQAIACAKTAVEMASFGKYWNNEEKRKWVEQEKDAWYLDGTPHKGIVILNDDLPSIIATNTNGQTILELKYPDNPMNKYKEWYHNYFKREDLYAEVSEMIHSNTNTEEIVSVVIDTIFSDIENNPKKKISELREEWL